jgi:hypothetical protein
VDADRQQRQMRQMRRFAGSCHFAFNQALAVEKARYERAEKKGLMPDCASCSQSGATAHKRRGERMLLARRSWIWSAPTPTSLPNGLTSRASRRKGKASHQEGQEGQEDQEGMAGR